MATITAIERLRLNRDYWQKREEWLNEFEKIEAEHEARGEYYPMDKLRETAAELDSATAGAHSVYIKHRINASFVEQTLLLLLAFIVLLFLFSDFEKKIFVLPF